MLFNDGLLYKALDTSKSRCIPRIHGFLQFVKFMVTTNEKFIALNIREDNYGRDLLLGDSFNRALISGYRKT